jgi:RNA polymerase sigma factor (sigma-70 family)
MDISTLIYESKQGSNAAQKCLFDEYADKMMLVCKRYLKKTEDAEEILSDGFYNFFKGLNSFVYKNDAAVYAWLKKIMVNECLMFLRKKNVFTIMPELVEEDCPLQEEVLDNLSAAEIFNLILQLPLGYRTVFNLYVIEGIPHAEIACLLNVSEGTSKSQLSKAKTLLQKYLLQNGTEYVKRKSK